MAFTCKYNMAEAIVYKNVIEGVKFISNFIKYHSIHLNIYYISSSTRFDLSIY